MDLDLKNLPDDASLPKDIVISLVDELEIKYQEKIHYLEEQLRLFKNELFGRSSEKRHEPHADQLPLFTDDDKHAVESRPADDDKIVIAAHCRKKRGRKPLPADLPRVDIIHDLSEEEKQCACGARLTRFGEEPPAGRNSSRKGMASAQTAESTPTRPRMRMFVLLPED